MLESVHAPVPREQRGPFINAQPETSAVIVEPPSGAAKVD
jgi:hypothetical protein